MSNCNTCGVAMKPMFMQEYCPNHCDMPLDKRVAARKKDEEEKNKNVNNRPNPSPAPGNTGTTPSPSSGLSSQGSNSCPKCGGTKYIKLTGKYYCISGLGGTGPACNGSWDVPDPVVISGLGGWVPYTGIPQPSPN